MSSTLPLVACTLVLAVAPLACATSGNGFSPVDDGGPPGSQGDDGPAASAEGGGAPHDGSASVEGGGATDSSAGSDGGTSDSSTAADTSSTADGSSGVDGAPGGDASGDGPPIVSPFDISWCPGAEVSEQQILAIFAPAATSATLGSVTLDAQQRQCQDQTGCQGWTPTTTLPLYDIQWTGNGFAFDNPTSVTVPASGTAACTVPGPVCTVTVGPVSSGVYPPYSGDFNWSVSPSVNGEQAQVGDWSSDPSGDYIEWGATTTTSTCLFGTENGRIYGANSTYTEYQMVIYGQY